MLTEQQKFLLKMLKEIHEICQKNGIQYFLAGGTLIGAVRHKGFLPWDDDADLYMTRENWEKFYNACKKDIPPHRILQSPDTDLSYTNTFPRYASTENVAIHTHQILNKRFTGEVIDILILDPVSNDPELLKKYTYDLMLYSDVVNYAAVYGRRFNVKARHYIKYKLLQRIRGENYLRTLFENKLRTYFCEEGQIYAMRWGGNPLVFERSWFSAAHLVKFEDFYAFAPHGTCEYLTHHYGDEWYHIPSNVQHAAHNTASLLTITPREAEALCGVSNARRTSLLLLLSLRKVFMLATAQKDFQQQEKLLEAESYLVSKDATSRFQENAPYFRSSFSLYDTPLYEECFSQYIRWQLSAKIAGRDDWKGVYRFNHPLSGTLESDAFDRVAHYLFNSEMIGKASRIIQIRKSRYPLSKTCQDIEELIETYRKGCSCAQSGKAGESLSYAFSILRSHPENKSALKLALRALSFLSKTDSAHLALFTQTVASATLLLPHDGDVRYYQTLLHERTGVINSSEALREYQLCAQETHNGLTLNHINEKVTDNYPGCGKVSFWPKKTSLPQPLPRWAEEIESAYLNILNHVDRVCKAAAIEYIVNPLLVHATYINQENAVSCYTDKRIYTLFISAENAEKLIRLIKSDPALFGEPFRFEYMGNNPFFPDFSMRVFDKRTVDYHPRHGYNYQYPSISICIQILQPARLSKKARRCLKIWKNSCYRNRIRGSLRTFLFAAPLRIAPKGVRLKIGEYLFVKCLTQAKKQRESYCGLIGNEKIPIPSSLLESTTKVSYRNKSYPAPANIATYLNVSSPKNFTLKSHDHNSISILTSTRVTGQKLEELGLDFKFYRSREKLLLLKAPFNAIRTTFLAVFQEQKVLLSKRKLEQIYLPKKDYLVELFESGDSHTLRKEFLELSCALESCKGLSLSHFDQTIQTLYEHTLLDPANLHN